jgi:hypothetical protein
LSTGESLIFSNRPRAAKTLSSAVGPYRAEPFLLLFVGGYYWAGFTTLWQEYQGKLAFERQRELAADRAEA